MTYAVRPFELHHPRTVEEALALAAKHPGAPYLAGGTDLVVNLRKRLAEPEHVIALGGIEALRGITVANGVMTLGALTAIADVAGDPDVQAHAPLLAEAAGLVAGPTLRGMGTLGGNVCLDTRCRYYNQSYFWRKANDFCLKKDGEVCHVAPGGAFCWAAYAGDTGPALLTLDAELELAGPEGARRVPLAEFYGTDGRWSIGAKPGGKKPGELLLRVHVPVPESGWQGVYEKLRVRDSIDYPLVGVAMRARFEGDGSTLSELRIALTAVNPRPTLVTGLEELAGRRLDLDTLEAIQKKANRVAKPMRTAVADPAYRRSMVGSLVAKAAARLSPTLASALTEQRARSA